MGNKSEFTKEGDVMSFDYESLDFGIPMTKSKLENFLQLPRWKDFILEINNWLDDGCPPHRAFERYIGLCHNYDDFIGVNVTEDRCKLGDAFDGVYPFNSCAEEYESEGDNDRMYENVKRLAFIRSMRQVVTSVNET